MILAIYGAGGLGKEIYDSAKYNSSQKFEEIFFIDDNDSIHSFYGIPVLSFEKFLEGNKPESCHIIIAVGEPSIRAVLLEKIVKQGYSLSSIIHSTSVISPTCSIGFGTYIGPFSFISSNTIISVNVVIQPHAMVGHDVEIGNSSVIGPNSAIAGSCVVGDRTYIGMNACIEQKHSVGDDVIIGMSSCVTRDIPSEMIAMGYPARVIGKNENKKVF